MSFHLSRTKPFWKSLRLFVAFDNKSRGDFFFLSWGSQRDFKLYEGLTCIEQTVPPLPFKVHFTEVQATSVACFRGILTSALHRAATWSSVHTLTRHYFRIRTSRWGSIELLIIQTFYFLSSCDVIVRCLQRDPGGPLLEKERLSYDN